MIKIKQAVIVEGRYDKVKLSGILDTLIIETEGFGIFSDKEKQRLIRYLAEKRGIVVLTDSDSAGFKIRSFISSITRGENVTDVYIPDVFGKEKRKDKESKEGKIGVEGIDNSVILEALQKAGVFCEQEEKDENKREISRTDFFEDGISGRKDSSTLRKRLAKSLDLPERISTSSLLRIINMYMTYEEYKKAVEDIKRQEVN